jgi:hypothetical protein
VMIWVSLNLLFRIKASSRHTRPETSIFQWALFEGHLHPRVIVARKPLVFNGGVLREAYSVSAKRMEPAASTRSPLTRVQ